LTLGTAPCITRSFSPFLPTTNPEDHADVALRRGSSYHAGDLGMLHFEERCGKSREVPVRHDREQMLFEYIAAAGLQNAPKDVPIFRTVERKTGRLTKNSMYVADASFAALFEKESHNNFSRSSLTISISKFLTNQKGEP